MVDIVCARTAIASQPTGISDAKIVAINSSIRLLNLHLFLCVVARLVFDTRLLVLRHYFNETRFSVRRCFSPFREKSNDANREFVFSLLLLPMLLTAIKWQWNERWTTRQQNKKYSSESTSPHALNVLKIACRQQRLHLHSFCEFSFLFSFLPYFGLPSVDESLYSLRFTKMFDPKIRANEKTFLVNWLTWIMSWND